MSAENQKEVKLALTKSTKGTHVYGSNVDGAAISSVYINKASLPAVPPQNITITIAWEQN